MAPPSSPNNTLKWTPPRRCRQSHSKSRGAAKALFVPCSPPSDRDSTATAQGLIFPGRARRATQPIKGGPPSLCSQLLVDGLSGDGPVSKWGRNQERKGTIRSEGSNTTPRTERRVAAQVEGACGWAGWRPSPRGMGDRAS